MTSPAGYIPITYSAADLQREDLSWFFWIVKGLDELPDVRGEDTVVPGTGGRTEGSRKNDTLPIELRGQVTADPDDVTEANRRASWRTNMRDLRELFASDRERADLVATLEDGTVVSISARPLNIVKVRDIGSVYAFLSIELEGYNDWAEVVGS